MARSPQCGWIGHRRDESRLRLNLSQQTVGAALQNLDLVTIRDSHLVDLRVEADRANPIIKARYPQPLGASRGIQQQNLAERANRREVITVSLQAP